MDKSKIGSRIKEARVHSNFTQEKLAEKVNKGTTYISDIERGAKSPSLNLLVEIVNALNTSSDYILRGEVESGKKYIYDDITTKLENLTPKQRLGILDLIDTYIKSLK